MLNSTTVLNRRTWLKGGMTASLASFGALALIGTASAIEPTVVAAGPQRIGAKRFPGLKTSINAYSFHLRLAAKGPGGMTLEEVMDFCVAHGADAIDPTGYFFSGYPTVPSTEVLNTFKRRALSMGLTISGTGIRNDFTNPDPAIRTEGVQRAKNWIEAAARLGAPVLRVFSGAEQPKYATEEVMKWLVDALRECAEYGQQFGVVVGVQNHGDFLQTAERCIEVVKQVASPWLGIVVDTGNFKTPDPYKDIADIVPYAVNWQVKESPLGNGNPVRTDVRRLIEIIGNGGYRGFVPLETIEPNKGKPGYDPRVEAAKLLAEIANAIQA